MAITAAVRQSCRASLLEQLIERLSTTVAALPDRHAAQRRADVLRRLIEQIDFHVGEEAVPVTMSCGLTVATASDTIDSAFERADQALYRAKRTGRNRCICI